MKRVKIAVKTRFLLIQEASSYLFYTFKNLMTKDVRNYLFYLFKRNFKRMIMSYEKFNRSNFKILKTQWTKNETKSKIIENDEKIDLDQCDIYYINLAHRDDRNKEIQEEFKKIGVSNYRRYEAIKRENGALGCALSHFNILNSQLKNSKKLLMIIEDDAFFLESREYIDRLLQEFVNDTRLAVLSLGFNHKHELPVSNNLKLVHESQTASCYVVKAEHLDKLTKTFEVSIKLLEKNYNIRYKAIDQVWKKLQNEINFVIPTKRVVCQRESYSDIEKRNTNYGV